MKLFSALAALLVSFASVESAAAELSAPALKRVSYQSAATGLERDYYVYLPEGFAQKDHWPILLFLQGNGERGNGKDELDWLFTTGPLFEAWTQQRHLPFVILVPQLPMFHQEKQGFITGRKKERIRYPRPEEPCLLSQASASLRVRIRLPPARRERVFHDRFPRRVSSLP